MLGLVCIVFIAAIRPTPGPAALPVLAFLLVFREVATLALRYSTRLLVMPLLRLVLLLLFVTMFITLVNL